MERQNLTLSLPRSLLKKAKMLAVKREKSLNQLIREVLEEEVIENRRYKQAKEKHLELLVSGFDLGTKGRFSISREEAHARR